MHVINKLTAMVIYYYPQVNYVIFIKVQFLNFVLELWVDSMHNLDFLQKIKNIVQSRVALASPPISTVMLLRYLYLYYRIKNWKLKRK